MARFVSDSRTGRWVIIAPGRVARPHDNLPAPPGPHDPSCPFCPENDALNEEVFRIDGSLPDGRQAWKIRVIKNKYPLTDIHEVIIHSPDHEKDIDELDLGQVELILQTYRARFNFHKAHGTVLIFNNHDIHAGASIGHPHSQLVVVPDNIKLETIPREPVENVVTQTKFFITYCPDFSQWPYEVWIAPNSISNFGQISDEEISDLAALLQRVLRVIVDKFKGETDIPYNFYIYHGPGWYLRIIPRLVHRAGFELGTGLSVNIIDPMQAAEEYKTALQN